MELITDVLRWISNLPWLTILTYVGSAGVIIPVTQFLKQKLTNKTKQKVFSIVGVLSALPVLVEQLASNSAWTAYLPGQFGWLFTTVIAVHAFLASPVYRRLLKTLQDYRQYLEYKQEAGNVSVQSQPITNPNNTLNTPVKPVAEEKKPLVLG